MKKIILILIMLLLCAGVAWGESTEDFTAEIIQKAKAGDAEAQTRLAEYYYAGRGVTQDIPKTVEWLRKAADQDYEPARTALFNLKTAVAGRGYDHLFGGVADPVPTEESAALYDEALAYFSGRGVEKNPYRAFELASESAAQGYVDAYVLVGQMYLDGQGPTRNYKKALDWFTKAADRNHVQAQYYLSVMYHDGKGTPVDFVQAFKWAIIAWDNAPGSDLVLQQMQKVRNRMSTSAASKAQFLADQWAKEHL